MAKVFKRIALLLTVALSVVCMCVFASACDDNGGNKTSGGYNITVVYPDGNAVDGTKDGKNRYDAEITYVEVQICVVTASGETGNCFDKQKLDANGKATLAEPSYTLKDGEKWKIQVNNVPEGYKCDDVRNYVCTTYFTAPGNYTVTLEAE